jgi:pyridoxamine 5'-phosphate oxidase family protein
MYGRSLISDAPGGFSPLFSDIEVEYLKSQRLARLATVSTRGQPDVVPVGFEFDGKYFWFGSATQEIFFRTVRYRNVLKGSRKGAVTIDDLESVNPWKPRSIKVYGTLEIMDHDGRTGPGKYLRMTPKVSWSAGIKDSFQGYQAKPGEWRTKTVHHEM